MSQDVVSEEHLNSPIEVDNPHRNNLFFNVFSVALNTAKSILQRRFSWSDVIKQIYDYGVMSLGIVVLCVTFTGIIIILEYSHHIKLVIGDDSLIPTFAMIMLTRELAPAVAAMLIVSKMGASSTAELGAMKTSEQLDAYRLLGLRPVDLFVSPQVIASAVATLLLTTIALFSATIGGWIAAVTVLTFTTDTFFQYIFAFTTPLDFMLCALKAVIFGASIPIISATYGFRCKFGSEGVGMATTDAVVANTIWIIISDFILTYVFSLLA